MQLNRNHLNAQFYTDHLMAKTKPLEVNTGVWIYMTGEFTVNYPCTKNSEVGYTLRRFTDNVGIPDQLRSDMAP